MNVSGSPPRRVYGHTSTALPTEMFGNALGLLGGVQYGSYQGDVGDFSVLQIDLPSEADRPAAISVAEAAGATTVGADETDMEGTGNGSAAQQEDDDEEKLDEEDEEGMDVVERELQLSGRWVDYPTEGECESRAYQGVTVAEIGGAKHLVVYGGIHESAASESLQLLDLSAKEWLIPVTEGRPPSGRMGCSAAFIPARSSSNRSHVVFIGGSDGNDLLRYFLWL